MRQNSTQVVYIKMRHIRKNTTQFEGLPFFGMVSILFPTDHSMKHP